MQALRCNQERADCGQGRQPVATHSAVRGRGGPRAVVRALVLAAGAWSVRPAADDAAPQPPPTDSLEAIADRAIRFYNDTYPDILFVQLPGGRQWVDSSVALSLLLGHRADNLDYEHPPSLREDLLYVSIERVFMMLRHNAASSSLFRVGDSSISARENVCIITLDPGRVAGNALRATAHLLDFPDERIALIPPARRLDPHSHLQFVLDHEAFHCLDALYNGPIPMSKKRYWSQYMLFRNEHAADAYAVAMHIARQGGVTPYAGNLLRIRGLSLYNADPDHLTCAAIERVLAIGAIGTSKLVHMDAQAVFRLGAQVREEVVPGYETYLEYRIAALAAMRRLGVGAGAEEDGPADCGVPLDADVRDELIRRSRRYYRELFG